MGTVAPLDRVFLDANVLFAASCKEDNSLLRLWRIEQIRLIASSYVLEEVYRNIRTDAQRSRVAVLIDRMESTQSTFNRQDPRLRGINLPPRDQPILIGAADAEATHLLSGDHRHFGRFYGKHLLGILILPPSDYLRDALNGPDEQ